MNGKTAKMMRGNSARGSGSTEYEVTPGSQRFLSANDPTNPGAGVRTCTIRLDPKCGRKAYQDMKQRYKQARRGDLTI